ncbi:MAG: TlyA family RNA methyltransferase [Deltaproteobacteria bacterium]|nr:TlyA family RNA methyltransferase [Deltaproteobacteria bacterium]
MKPKSHKIRLDRLLLERGLSPSREQAKALIMAGAVLVADRMIDKAGTLVAQDVDLRIKGEQNPYVGRGGLKLKGALQAFAVPVRDVIALDVGASTGGFTDCLLQEGAKKVYALDVGYGQLAWKIRSDERVVVIERTNIRYYDGKDLQDDLDLATIDASFISLKLVIPAVMGLLKKDAFILALIKPQFEVGKQDIEKNGVVKNPVLHQRVIAEIETFCRGLNLDVLGLCESPILGPAGNKEFFIYLKTRRGAD